jgi:LacI family transcriptional regulator
MRLGLCLNLNHTKGRQLLRGIHAALESWPEVEVVMIPYHLRLWDSDPLAGVDAVLAEFDKYRQAKPFWELELPVINLSNALPTARFPKSAMDEARIARLAAEHLIGRGYEHFLVLGAAGHHAAELRAEAFCTHISAKGRPVARLDGWFDPDNRFAAELQQWLAASPVPLGIFGWTDLSAYSAAKIAHKLGMRMPEDVGIIGAGDDDILTSIAPVTLSSIHLHWESVGAAAVEMLSVALGGTSPHDRLCQRCELVQRASSERYPVADSRVARCLALIERDLASDLSIPALARKVGCSKRSLEENLRKELNTSPARYILERRTKRARRLLRETTLPVYEIAAACGFADANYFASAFHRVTGLSPSAYRRTSEP